MTPAGVRNYSSQQVRAVKREGKKRKSRILEMATNLSTKAGCKGCQISDIFFNVHHFSSWGSNRSEFFFYCKASVLTTSLLIV